MDLLTTILERPNLACTFRKRRDRMLADKNNVTEFLVWFLQEYPASMASMKANPDVQNRFNELIA